MKTRSDLHRGGSKNPDRINSWLFSRPLKVGESADLVSALETGSNSNMQVLGLGKTNVMPVETVGTICMSPTKFTILKGQFTHHWNCTCFLFTPMLMEALVDFLFFFFSCFFFSFNPRHHFWVSQGQNNALGSEPKEAIGGQALKHQLLRWSHPSVLKMDPHLQPSGVSPKTLSHFVSWDFNCILPDKLPCSCQLSPAA